MILQRDGGDLSSIRLTRPLLKGSTTCGLLLMVLPRSRIAAALWMILPWTTNANYAHDGFPNLFFWTDRCRHHPLLDLMADSASPISPISDV
jgi:hypothetical protein